MSSLVFILICIVASLLVLSKIPGLEHFVKPIVDMFMKGFMLLLESAGNWVIWMVKLLLSSHIDLARNLALSADTIDPSIEIRKNEA